MTRVHFWLARIMSGEVFTDQMVWPFLMISLISRRTFIDPEVMKCYSRIYVPIFNSMTILP
jgi:hypothetical protein